MSGVAAKLSLSAVSAAAVDQFPVQATVPARRQWRSLKYDDTFLVLDSHGDIGAAGSSDGLFHSDTRFLSQLELRLNNVQPLLLGSNLSDDNTLLTVDLTNPDFVADGKIVLPKDTIHIVRSIFLWRKTAYQRIGLHNYGASPVRLTLALMFDGDFADLFEVRGSTRKRRGHVEKILDGDTLVFIYRGLDDVVRRTVLRFDPLPATLDQRHAEYQLDLAPGDARSLFVTARCNPSGAGAIRLFPQALLSVRRQKRTSTAGDCSVETSNDIFNEMLCRAAADLNMLTTETPQGPYPYAGIPWYSTTFGRDGIVTAIQMLWLAPQIARGVLRRLAAYQATADDPRADAQPGKILHEMRGGEMAAMHEIPFGLYYGSVDSTPLFVLLAGLYFERTQDRETLVELWPAIESALTWIDGPGDPDGDGFVEYHRASADGLANQGWKDSFDAIFHADGRLAEGNIALVEVQAYVYGAKRMAAHCARHLGLSERAAALEAAAERLAHRFEASFWSSELDTYVLALDGSKAPCCVRTSNAGQVLFTGLADAKRARKVATGLLGANAFSGWGIRTVSTGEARYNPMSYHDGSIWPHDNALIAMGFAHYGLKGAVVRVFDGLFDAASYMDLRRLPELFCGFRRQPQRGPTLYPVACAPQAWASAVPFALLAASLGLEFDVQAPTIRLRSPRLPGFLDEVTIRNLSLGDAQIDLRIRCRAGQDATLDVLRSHGTIDCAILPAD